MAVIAWQNRSLDDGGGYPREIVDPVERFHAASRLTLPPLGASPAPTIRAVLRPYIEAYRMAGQEVVLEDALPVPITFSLSIRVAAHFFRSEVRRAVDQALGTGAGGFFEPGRRAFGEDVYASDLIQVLMDLDGVESVCLNRFERLGSQFLDQVDAGVLEFDGLELAVCDNDPVRPERGYYRTTFHGGRRG